MGATGSYGYDDHRRMTRETDRNGFSFYYKYDSEGRCIASAGQDKLWRVKLKYEPGRTRVTEADCGEWIFYFNRAGTVTRIVDPYGGARERVTDASGRIIQEIDSGGRVMRWLYDERGRNTGRQDRWGNLWPTIDEAPNLPNPLAHEVPSTPLGLQWGEAGTASADEPPPVPYTLSHVAAEVLAQPSSILPEPRSIRDAAGRVVEEIDIYGRSETFRHDAAGNLIQRTDKDGREYHYTVVSWNLRGTESDPLGNTVEYGYTLREKIALIVDGNGNESHYTYDYKDRITSVTRRGVLRESYQYDIGDRLIEKRDGDGNLLLRFEVGENGLHSKRILSSGEVHHYEYDARGNFTRASTEKYDVRMTYDWAGRRTSDKRDDSGISHAYRGMQLARTEYFDRFTVTYETRPDGEVLITTPVGGTHRRRTADGRVGMQLGNGSQMLRRYDGDGRCVGRIHWRSGKTETVRWTRYEYSPEGELRRVTDSWEGAVEFRYDAAHRLIAEVRGLGENPWPPVEHEVQRAIDPDATVEISRDILFRALDSDATVNIPRDTMTRVLDLEAIDPDTTVRIPLEAILRVLDPDATIRIPQELLSGVLDGDATREIPLDRIRSSLADQKRPVSCLDTGESNRHAASSLSSTQGEGWDGGNDSRAPAGNVLPSANPNGFPQTETVGPIPCSASPEAGGGWVVRRYDYDPAGNLLSMPTMPRMDYIEGNRLATSSSGTFVYNRRNHLAEQHDLVGTCTRYHYDSMDLLVMVEWSDRAEAWSAEYDGLCRRIAKTLGERRTEYWWDGDRPAAERGPDGRLRLYVYANEEAFLPFMFVDYAGVDAEPESGKAYFVFYNQVGLAEWIEDETGKTVWRAEDIDPYGWITVGEGNFIEYDLRFPGHYFDPETGLHYNRFRYYSPVLGRYLQSDPKGQSGGINLYAYPANPLVWVDVLGLTSGGESPCGSPLHQYYEENGHQCPYCESANKPNQQPGVTPSNAEATSQSIKNQIDAAYAELNENLARQVEEDKLNQGYHTSNHADDRDLQRSRPTNLALSDARQAWQSDVTIQTSDGRYVVRVKTREHIFERNGQHVTSILKRSEDAHRKLLQSDERRLIMNEEFEEFRKKFGSD